MKNLAPHIFRQRLLIEGFYKTLVDEKVINVGAEPDKCFYIRNLSAVKGKKRIDLDRNPPPDLVV